jgi:hypothetical protein
MATDELRELRHRYKAAYTIYLSSVQALSDASQEGRWPSAEVLAAEEKGMAGLTQARGALLAALREHGAAAAAGPPDP